MPARFAVLLLAVAFLPTVDAASRPAQAGPDAILRRIVTEGTAESQLPSLAQALMDAIGPRLTGSPEQARAVQWAVSTFNRWGIAARDERYGTWKGWRRGTAHLDLMAPRVRSLRGMLLTWSAGTKESVVGPAIVFPRVANPAEFEAVLPQFRGKFVLLSHAESTCRPDSNLKAFETAGAFDQLQKERGLARDAWYAGNRQAGVRGVDLLRRLADAGALGLVTSLLAPPQWTSGWGVGRLGSASVTNVPEIGLSCEDYGLVFRLATNDQGPVLRVNADAEFLGEVPVANVIAELPGRELPQEYVVLSTHLDSWDAASGATDNGATAVAVMEAMRILRAIVPSPRRSIVAGLWSGEEQGFNGSRAFAQDHPEVARGAQAIFDHDNGTGRFVHVSAQGPPASADFMRRWLLQIPSDVGGPARVEASDTLSRGIDAFSFSCSGAPAFSFSSVGWEYETYTWHTDLDTFDKIVVEDVRRNAIMLAMLAYLASEDPTRLPRGTSPNSSTPCPASARRSN